MYIYIWIPSRHPPIASLSAHPPLWDVDLDPPPPPLWAVGWVGCKSRQAVEMLLPPASLVVLSKSTTCTSPTWHCGKSSRTCKDAAMGSAIGKLRSA